MSDKIINTLMKIDDIENDNCSSFTVEPFNGHN